MCCAVQNPIETFLAHSEEEMKTVSLPIIKRKGKKALIKRKVIHTNKEDIKQCTTIPNSKREISESENAMDTEESAGGNKKKKKKWKSMSLSDTGFNLSLFPRHTRPERIDPDEEERLFNKIDKEIYEYEDILCKYDTMDKSECGIMEGNIQRKDKFARSDRDRKARKAGKQVKDKYCRSVRNNKGRKKLYIHHRLFKLINIDEKRISCHLPSAKHYNDRIENNKSTNETRSKLKPAAAPYIKPAPVQNLRHTLHASNAPWDIDNQIVSLLVNLQHRDLTPEDYEILCRLDESVAPKTIDKSTLERFKTDIVTDATSGDICAVCMDAYEVGQNRKFLPCNHVFHAKCIDMWLENSSQNCPIDGLPLDNGS